MAFPDIVCLYFQSAAHAGTETLRLNNGSDEERHLIDTTAFSHLLQSRFANHAHADIAHELLAFVYEGAGHPVDDTAHGTVKGEPCFNADAQQVKNLRKLVEDFLLAAFNLYVQDDDRHSGSREGGNGRQDDFLYHQHIGMIQSIGDGGQCEHAKNQHDDNDPPRSPAVLKSRQNQLALNHG